MQHLTIIESEAIRFRSIVLGFLLAFKLHLVHPKHLDDRSISHKAFGVNRTCCYLFIYGEPELDHFASILQPLQLQQCL
jgi:hypothetical protein